MRVEEFKYFPFTLKLKKPFKNSTTIFSERKGFIISVKDNNGNVSYGECSPLPDFSKESFEESGSQLEQISTSLINFHIPSEPNELHDKAAELTNLPSVIFGLEQSLLSLCLLNDRSFSVGRNSKSPIEVNAVIGIDCTENILDIISSKIRTGYRTFKLKVGRENPYEDFELLSRIRETFGYDITLRLDANRIWSADEALEILEGFKQFDIEYVEEPCQYFCSSLHVAEDIQIPVALDESIENFDDAVKTLHECNFDFLVLKPTVLGGFISTIKLIDEAERLGKKIIISSSFESSIGKSGLVFLASLINHNHAHGLDTVDFFETDICTDPYPVNNGEVEFSISEYPPKILNNLQ